MSIFMDVTCQEKFYYPHHPNTTTKQSWSKGTISLMLTIIHEWTTEERKSDPSLFLGKIELLPTDLPCSNKLTFGNLLNPRSANKLRLGSNLGQYSVSQEQLKDLKKEISIYYKDEVATTVEREKASKYRYGFDILIVIEIKIKEICDENVFDREYGLFFKKKGTNFIQIVAAPEPETSKFKIDNDADDNGNKSCAICLEEFEDGVYVTTGLCTHMFHKHCINLWLEKSSTCPLCRDDMLTPWVLECSKGVVVPQGITDVQNVCAQAIKIQCHHS